MRLIYELPKNMLLSGSLAVGLDSIWFLHLCFSDARVTPVRAAEC